VGPRPGSADKRRELDVTETVSPVRRRVPAAVGAVAAQITLAFGSFILQLLAARALGAEGLGVFAMLFGSVVIATAVSSGLIGDSLTVLDRHDPAIRSALAWMAAAVVGVAATAAFVLASSLGDLPASTALLFAGATAAFMTADLFRRTLMACQRCWRLVVVDSVAFAVALGFLLAASGGGLSLNHFLGALWIGQVVACLVALRSLPRAERTIPARRWGDVHAVISFGSWRAVQQFVRPTTLNLMRWLVLITAGQVAVGQLEAARIFVAPAMLLVQGVGAYLFSSYAAGRDEPLSRLLRRADRGAAVLLAGCCAMAPMAALAVPFLGSVLTDGDYELDTISVVGWAVYAASCAVVLPYGSLAAVRGDQAKVLGLRVVDSLIGLGATAVALLWLGVPVAVAPWLLSVGSVAAGIIVRQRLLVPRVEEIPAPEAADSFAEPVRGAMT
jgi:O-antigen/teichoic acid export membrane protein